MVPAPFLVLGSRRSYAATARVNEVGELPNKEIRRDAALHTETPKSGPLCFHGSHAHLRSRARAQVGATPQVKDGCGPRYDSGAEDAKNQGVCRQSKRRTAFGLIRLRGGLLLTR